jgi:hypothetical protein
VIEKEGANKSNHPIQNPLLFVTEPRAHDTIISTDNKLPENTTRFKYLGTRMTNQNDIHTELRIN